MSNKKLRVAFDIDWGMLQQLIVAGRGKVNVLLDGNSVATILIEPANNAKLTKKMRMANSKDAILKHLAEVDTASNEQIKSVAVAAGYKTVHSTIWVLKKDGLIKSPSRGVYVITQTGKDLAKKL
jgi:predicted transcriptional regulator